VKIVDQAAENAKYLTKSEVEGILNILITNTGITSNQLIQLTGIPKETLRDFKRAVSSLLKPLEGDSIAIREDMLSTIVAENPKPHDWSLIKTEPSDFSNQLAELRKKFPTSPQRNFDQFYATEETSIFKASILAKKGVLDGARVALLGDDDLVSAAIHIIGGKPASVTVFDIDEELLTAITNITRELGTNSVHTVKYDARKEIPPQYKGKFDVVVTDPPYTRQGISLFVNRGIDLLDYKDKDIAKHIFLYYGNSFKTPEKTLKVQETIQRSGLVIEDKIDKFARYNGAESIGDASSLYVLRTTPSTMLTKDYLVNQPIYTFEESKEEKFPYVDHFTFKLFGVPTNIVSSKSAVQKAAGDFCTLHKLKVRDERLTQFKNGGLTLTFILSNSNLLVHTWPEHNAVHLDLLTCSPICNKESLGESLSRLFNTKRVEVRQIE
jgi:predicted methyltransferase